MCHLASSRLWFKWWRGRYEKIHKRTLTYLFSCALRDSSKITSGKREKLRFHFIGVGVEPEKMKKERWVSTRFYAVLLLEITFSGKSGQSLRRNSPNNFLVSFLSALENIWVFISTFKTLKIMRFHLVHKSSNMLMMCNILGLKINV